ncbi:interleukin-2 receptor subunit beta isoform X3 [Castor canadensis]|uniref:Interleukin-2 receptor subunit beta n=1 Tax=Castor canadensis TaxID=51338 RepID=A0A8B7W2J6_CASCN
MAAPSLSWCLALLILLLPLASMAVKDPSQLSCFYNSRANISCVWSLEGGLQATACHIHAQSNSRLFCSERPWNLTCELLPVTQASWACNLILGSPNSQKLTSADLVNISVMCWEGERWRMVVTQDFRPFENLRLQTPTSLQVSHVESHRCNITWHVSQISHYIDRDLEFEVRKRSPGHSWEEAPVLSLKQRQQWIQLEMLDPNTPYELQVRVRPQRGDHSVWSTWSQPLAFRTRPADPGKVPELPWFGHFTLGLGVVVSFLISVYFLAKFRHIGPWLKKVLKCHIPDPSEFFPQHGGDVQKWLSSPLPSSSFSPAGLEPEISPVEVLDRDAKATQLLLLQQDKASPPLPSPSSYSQTSCFTNQGYFFFHLPDALEIEACQVYFTYDPCAEEEPEEGVPRLPTGSPLPSLLPGSGEYDAYCTFPPGDDLLLFSPSLIGGSSPPHTALGCSGAHEERLPSALQEGCPRDWGPQPLGPPAPAVPGLLGLQSPVELPLGEAGAEVPVPHPGEGAGPPGTNPPGQGQGRVPTSGRALNTDVYLSLQELQAQDPAHLV